MFAVSAYGQGYQTFREEMEQITRRTKWQVGPFRIFPSIGLKDIGYDGNVYYQREQDEPVSDFTATFSPEIKVYVLYRNFLILSLTENPQYVYYAEQKRERRWNNIFSPEVKILFLNRFVISGGYEYENRRWRATSEFDVRANELRERIRGSFFYETARGTSFGLSASIVKISYEDITLPGEEIYLSLFLNREEESRNFEFYYKIFSNSFFFIDLSYVEYVFEHPESRWRDSYAYQVSSGIQFPLLGKIKGAFSLGYKKHVPLSQEKKEFSGLVGDTRLEFRVGRFKFQLEYLRNNHFSYWTESIFFIENRYGAGISFYLTEFLRLDYNYSYGRANYPEITTIMLPEEGVVEIKRKDVYNIHSLGFVVRFVESLGIGLRVNYWDRDSNYFYEDRNRSFIGAYVTYEF
jgi:hypothetical protein